MYILLHVSISLDLAAHMGHSLKLRSLFNYTVIPKEEEIKAKEDTTTQKKKHTNVFAPHVFVALTV